MAATTQHEDDKLTLDGINQFYINVETEDSKLDALCDIFKTLQNPQSVVFCWNERAVGQLKQQLTDRKFKVSAIHEAMDSSERQKILNEFRSGSSSSRILILGDLLATSIHVREVPLVINYDLPRTQENYLDRIGLQQRFGRKRVSITFTTDGDSATLQDLEQFHSTMISPLPANMEGILQT
ncbi:translation initiation factor eIF4A [Gryganskiella cystojenkinii]|nr:translation initiation factor eIF4A [Gryganskiella cystojenkinii]